VLALSAIPTDRTDRLAYIIELAWDIFFQRICSGRTAVNKEASMQLHLSTILHGLGEMFCIMPDETFSIELESKYDRSNIDIVCSYGDVKAAIELKCFKKASNRATDLDMYDVFKDIYRLQNFEGFQVKKFICLTDNPYYATSEHNGHAGSVSIQNGIQHKAGDAVTPSWIGLWKDKSRDKELILTQDIAFNWVQQDKWYYVSMSL
jgi:hypothetical protein